MRKKATTVGIHELLTSRKKILFILIILVWVFLIFSPSLKNSFINYDDDVYITQNTLIQDLSAETTNKILFSYTGFGGTRLTLLNFALDYHLWGADPFMFHLINIIFHLFNCLLVFVIIKKLLKNDWVALLSMLLFGIHPMKVESVAWASERKDVLYAFFFLLSSLFYIIYSKKGKWNWLFYLMSLLAFFLSWHAKFAAAALPLILIGYDIFSRKKEKWTRLFIEKIPFFIPVLLFAYRMLFHWGPAIEKHTQGQALFKYSFSFIDRIFMAAYSLVFYVVKWVFPYPLSAIYPYPEKTNGGLPVIYYLSMFVVILIGFLIFRFLKKYVKIRQVTGISILFFIATIGLFLHIINIKGVVITADRYTYIPFLGFSVLAAYLFWQWIKGKARKKLVFPIIVLLLLVIFHSISTFNRTKVWESSISLFKDVIKTFPDNVISLNNLGEELNRTGKPEEAVPFLNKAIRVNPKYYQAYNNRAVSKINMKNYPGAIEDLNLALNLNNRLLEAYSNRANALIQLGDLGKGEKDCLSALEIDSTYNTAKVYLAYIFMARGDSAESYKILNRVLAVEKNDSKVYYNRGNYYLGQRMFDEAISDYTEAIRLSPNYELPYNNRGTAKAQKGQVEEAIKDFSSAIEINKDYSEALNNRAYSYVEMGKYAEAEVDCNTILSTNPNDMKAIYNRGRARLELGKFAEALQDMEVIIQYFPADPNINFIAGKSAYHLGIKQKACVYLRKAAASGQIPEAAEWERKACN